LALDPGWTLSASAFNRLLAILDEDRDAAAAAYGQLRQRIVGLHRWWGAFDPEALADLTLDRAARKLQEGATVDRADFGAYLRGVARMIFLEAARQPVPVALEHEPITDVTEADDAPLECLDQCLDKLPPDERRLVLRYYEGDHAIPARQALARQMGVSATALRLRTHRLRVRLEGCVSDCLRRRGRK
jgi:DNA-directed RNA polymerase specialized sigma24 family protein